MGTPYQEIEKFLPAITGSHVMVEIGSDRGEGSTVYLDDLAGRLGTKLYSVDILPKAQHRLQHICANTEFVVASGSQWSQDFHQHWHNISVLYLDNFDYIWDINDVRPAIQQQQHLYAEMGMTMSNQNCQVEHLAQMINLAPCMHPQGVIVFDDTYCINDCWIGKCGPAVVYMKTRGWQVVWNHNCGVIMRRVDNPV